MSFRDRAFCAEVFQQLRQNEALPAGARCLLAVSGGLDSMVLLDFFQRFASKKFRAGFVVAHLDHGLRPDSAAVAAALAAWCRERKLTYVTQRREVPASASQTSLEARARDLRYSWLEATAIDTACDRIFTAHSASDQLETMLMHLIRGTITGLGGMAAQRPLGTLRLYRPLLGVTRDQIAAYASHHQLQWWEDSSNANETFFRNRLRHQLIPWLRRENPGIETSLTEAAAIWRDEQQWLQTQAHDLYQRLVSRQRTLQSLAVTPLLQQPPALQRALIREILSQSRGDWKRFGHRHIEAILALAAGEGEKRLDLPGLQVRKYRHQLIFAAAD